MPRTTFLAAATIFAFASTAVADFITYKVPNLPLALLLEGKVIHNAGGTVSLHHKLGKLHLSRNDILDSEEIETFPNLFSRQLRKAKTADASMEAARWALKHGLLRHFYLGVDQALKLDPTYGPAQKVRSLQQKLDVDLGDSAREEQELRKQVRDGSMKIAMSKHFILLHDTPDKAPELYGEFANKRRPRATERLELLETVYEAFLLKFYSQGVELQVPQERLKVVLFNEEADYKAFATRLSPALRSAIGFFDPKLNISFFFDHGSSSEFRELREMSDDLQERRKDYVRRKNGEAVRLCDTLSLIVAIDQENSDIEVVSHEATHQMAANTGLFPRDVLVPKWVHEGLATYFEAPKDATWSGMGSVNEERLNFYRVLQANPKLSSIDYVVGDQLFYTPSHEVTLYGYAQGWALTHFLMDRHFVELMKFYRRLGELPPDMIFRPDFLVKLFDECFASDRQALDREWRNYMRTLKTDFEVLTKSSSR